MPTHYDTTEDGQNENIAQFLFSFLARIVLFLHFIQAEFNCQKHYYIILLVTFEKLHPS